MRADVFLVDHGHATTRSQAQRLIASGVEWRLTPLAPWKKVAKNGDDIPAGAELKLLDDAEVKYISRGGLKLEGALNATGLKVQGLRCLDVGQSTGGFTDCLLQRGAAQVIGVDVGQGQLHDRLREDVRVICVEGVNARFMTTAILEDACEEVISERWEEEEDNETLPQAPYAWMRNGGQVDEEYDDSRDAKDSDIEAFKAERAAKAKARAEGTVPTERRRKAEYADVNITPEFDFVTGDVSFISLTLVLPAVVRMLKPHGHLLMLVKPQFELQPGQVGKGGIVRDPALFKEVEARVRTCLAELGLEVKAWMESAIEGGDGNHEFFVHAVQGAQIKNLDQPLPDMPAATATKRVSRTVLRELKRIDVIDDEEDGYNVPGPARPKRKKA
ncbi:MAG: TlyA family RNA methyltransferase [Comamonas sp.]|uniref:TlyA family RNA methyltransferase n=1 Tax=Comamonas avium TaxID=2762231 RepID=A0ABR8S9C4_9BURK|nr:MULTISPECIES: TlyA family RNA methyltransferase [Comamonas]MBD7960084.1 TlyA family RNA methyltransferase [Comamonas avium]MBD9400409.1 TlyA family RNA methyltransferase [Comamonas sp. CMM02]MBP9941364.1 TlyA family RNA methyltransferase [Comamonas sp.]